MQFQRIQNLWLLVALICLVAYLLLPFGKITDIVGSDGVYEVVLRPVTFYGLLIPLGLSALLVVIALCSFKSLAFQGRLAMLAFVMELVSICCTLWILCGQAVVGTIQWQWSSALLLTAAILTACSLKGISHDRHLLSSYDRLR